jgi:hypothetical protein
MIKTTLGWTNKYRRNRCITEISFYQDILTVQFLTQSQHIAYAAIDTL